MICKFDDFLFLWHKSFPDLKINHSQEDIGKLGSWCEIWKRGKYHYVIKSCPTWTPCHYFCTGRAEAFHHPRAPSTRKSNDISGNQANVVLQWFALCQIIESQSGEANVDSWLPYNRQWLLPSFLLDAFIERLFSRVFMRLSVPIIFVNYFCLQYELMTDHSQISTRSVKVVLDI